MPKNRVNASQVRPGTRCVLDTNVVLDLVAFRDPGVESIARAIWFRAVAPITSRACLEELRRVLAYPKLNLDEPGRLAAFEWFRVRAQLAEVPATAAAKSPLPLCTDADDQKFLELAWHSNAHCLVTKDKALLRLARAVAGLGRFAVLKPDQFEGHFRAARTDREQRTGPQEQEGLMPTLSKTP